MTIERERRDVKCSIEGCDRGVYARGWCGKHYDRWHTHGDPNTVLQIRGNPEAAFLSHVDRQGDDECWLWTGCVGDGGYGYFQSGGRARLAHRWAYEHFVGEIPDGMDLDHVLAKGCTNRNCVNWVRHLEPVTRQENLMRGSSFAALNAAKESCLRGHEFTSENIKIKADGRACRHCDNARKRARRRGISIDELLAEEATYLEKPRRRVWKGKV